MERASTYPALPGWRESAVGGLGTKTIAILQSNYIPWKGYFDLINSVDEFILYDDVQFTKNDWRNRNLIKTPGGLLWLTIPILVHGKLHQRIDEARVADPKWSQSHWKTIQQNYARCPFFAQYENAFASLYRTLDSDRLSEINYRFLTAICGILGIQTRITWSTSYTHVEGRSERLVSLCKQTGAGAYLSGPAAKAYLDETLFAKEGIAVRYMDYSGYPEYGQRFPPFEHGVSILDLIFNEGPEAPRYMKSFGYATIHCHDPLSLGGLPGGVPCPDDGGGGEDHAGL